MGVPQLDVVSPTPKDIWSQLAKSDPAATIFQTPDWLEAICASGGYTDASRLYTTPNGRQLVMPMVRRAGLPGLLPIAESLPAEWGSGGLVTDGQLAPADVTAVWADLTSLQRARVRLRVDYSNAEAWRTGTVCPKITVEPEMKYVLDLRGGFERVWKERFRGSVRNHARKAERSHLVVKADSSGALVPTFYELYLTWVEARAKKLGLPASIMLARAKRNEPLRKFHVVAEKLGDACRIWVAWLDGRPVATSILLMYGQRAVQWRTYNDMSVSKIPAGLLLHKLQVEHACTAGCVDYNMGCSFYPSLRTYKESLGGVPMESPMFTFDRVPIGRAQDAAARLKTGIRELRGRHPVLSRG